MKGTSELALNPLTIATNPIDGPVSHQEHQSRKYQLQAPYKQETGNPRVPNPNTNTPDPGTSFHWITTSMFGTCALKYTR